MEQGVRKVLGRSFCSSSRIPNIIARLFSTSEICFFFQESFEHCASGFDALWGNCSSKEIGLSSIEMAFGHCQFMTCFLNAFEGCPLVSDEMISVVGGCDADIVHVLGTLVRFDNFIKVFSHETGERG